MSNHNVAKAYANYTRQPILTDGVTFAQMLLTKSYAPETFESYMRSNVRYYVPRFSFESAMREMPQPLRNRIDDALFKLTYKNYDFYNPSNDLEIADEECRFVNAAMDFKEKMPAMIMQVSSQRIWQLFYTATTQKQKDSDLL